MMKYSIPTITIASFLSENIVTESTVQNTYIPEVTSLMGTVMTHEQYKARVESINNILSFSSGS